LVGGEAECFGEDVVEEAGLGEEESAWGGVEFGEGLEGWEPGVEAVVEFGDDEVGAAAIEAGGQSVEGAGEVCDLVLAGEAALSELEGPTGLGDDEGARRESEHDDLHSIWRSGPRRPSALGSPIPLSSTWLEVIKQSSMMKLTVVESGSKRKLL
jgi:hypothetical protein